MRLRDRLWLLMSQAVNALFRGGDPDESVSARAWRERELDEGHMLECIDRWMGLGHCKAVYEAQIEREQSRKEN